MDINELLLSLKTADNIPPRVRHTKATTPRKISECFVPAYSHDIKEDDYRIYWQHPRFSKMIRPIIGDTEIGSIKGGSGVGKTSLVRAIYAAIYEENIRARGIDPTQYTLGFKFKHPGCNHSIVHLDTEQSKNLNYKRNRMLYGMINGDKSARPANFWPFYLKGIPMEYKLKYLEDFCITKQEEGAPVRFVVVDHVGDFVDDYNSERQAIDLFAELDELATTYGFSVLYLIHTNSTSPKQNGHLGSQGNRKNVCELFIEEDEEDPSLVKIAPHKLRDSVKDFTIFARRGANGTLELADILMKGHDDTPEDGDSLPENEHFLAQREALLEQEMAEIDAIFAD